MVCEPTLLPTEPPVSMSNTLDFWTEQVTGAGTGTGTGKELAFLKNDKKHGFLKKFSCLTPNIFENEKKNHRNFFQNIGTTLND